jgi:tetratricopeptide (TPR) repeat protein
MARVILLAILCILPASGQTGWEQDQSAGKAMLEQRRFEEAEPLLRLAIELASGDGREHPELAGELDLLARIYLAQMKLAEAEATFKRELALLEAKHGGEALEIVPALNNLGRVIQIDAKRICEARDLLLRVIAIREARQGPERPDIALDLIRLGRSHAAEKEYQEAEPLYKAALGLLERPRETQPSGDVYAQTLANYAELLQQTGRKVEAAKREARAKGLQKERAAKKRE